MKAEIGKRNHSSTAFFEGEKWLVITGLLGFCLAAVCGVWVMMHGAQVLPKGDVLKAFSFNAALGMFLLSTAAIMPLSALGSNSRAVFRWTYITLALYSYAAETVQNFRGVDPRFVKGGTPFDIWVGSIFTFVALLLVLFYLFAAISFFRRRAYQLRPELVVGIRYAMLAVILSFAAGIWISFNAGRYVGMHGNIIWLHGLGFHALQVVPLIAWLCERTRQLTAVRKRLIHVTGIAYLMGLLAVGWQTYLGLPVLTLSVLPILASICFLVTVAAGIWLLWQWKDRTPIILEQTND
ncbi:hypothetical protein [Brevibacillus choshinensis]|uniref:Uncharacterized protein n=1 Tax=Brevibacillus choshinensis TaxID=54911 RepID=A0ABX7FVH0_BRECH|nr:hypothetical protein [Brevibacillus choshinensis]QRG70248.1 hypothetical protein JNE38_14690 [Brevibacillus choshinensis]